MRERKAEVRESGKDTDVRAILRFSYSPEEINNHQV